MSDALPAAFGCSPRTRTSRAARSDGCWSGAPIKREKALCGPCMKHGIHDRFLRQDEFESPARY